MIFIFILIVLILKSFAHQTQHTDENEHFHNFNLKGNYSSNLTNEQISFVINSVTAAQRKFNSTQLDEISKSISVGLSTVTNYPWLVLTFNNQTKDAGFGGFAKLNKFAILTETGNYKLSYAMIMRDQTYSDCNNILANNKSQTYTQFSGDLINSQKSVMTAAAESATIYAGDDILKASKYVAQKINTSPSMVGSFSVIISSRSISNGAHYCKYFDGWAKLINFADLGWNYYIYRSYKNQP